MPVSSRRPVRSRRRLAAIVACLGLAAAVAPAARAESGPGGSDCPPPALMPGVEVGSARLRHTAACVPYVRTPDRRFDALAGYDFEPHYARVDGLRVHYVDEGPSDGEVVLMLHGEPSWSYLYRSMVPVLAEAGYRAIAVDLVGMGRSDKPVEQTAYSYLQHVEWMAGFLDAADLDGVTLFAQDWGSLIGLRVVADHPDRFARVVVANGRLPVVPEGFQVISVPNPPLPDPTAELPFGRCDGWLACFEHWATYALAAPGFRPSEILEPLTASELTRAEARAYDAPYPAPIYMTGVRVLPSLVNTIGEPPTNDAARAFYDATTMPVLTLFGRLDQNLGSDSVQSELRDRVPGARGQAHHAYEDANHFIQEDVGPDLARRVAAFIAANPLAERTGRG